MKSNLLKIWNRINLFPPFFHILFALIQVLHLTKPTQTCCVDRRDSNLKENLLP